MDYIKDLFPTYFTSPCLLLVCIFYTRLNSVYHPDLLFKKYVVLRNSTLSKILVSGLISLNFKGQKNESREKISIVGIILYITTGISFVFYLICLYLGSEFLASSDSFVVSNLFIALLIDLLNSFPIRYGKVKYKKLICFVGTLICILIIALTFYVSVTKFIELL